MTANSSSQRGLKTCDQHCGLEQTQLRAFNLITEALKSEREERESSVKDDRIVNPALKRSVTPVLGGDSRIKSALKKLRGRVHGSSHTKLQPRVVAIHAPLKKIPRFFEVQA